MDKTLQKEKKSVVKKEQLKKPNSINTNPQNNENDTAEQEPSKRTLKKKKSPIPPRALSTRQKKGKND